jgi:hypothetical protein
MRRLFLPLLLALGACGGEDPPPAPPGPPTELALSELCAALAEAECGRLAGCGLLSGPLDAASCATRVDTVRCAPIVAQLGKASAAGHVRYDPKGGAACRDATLAVPCSVGLEHDVLAPAACEAMVQSASPVGGACAGDYACVDMAWCDLSNRACPGVCRAFLGANETCGEASQRCADGLFCSPSNRRCRARVALGAPCEQAIENSCVDGFFCDGSQPGGPLCSPVRGRNTGCTTPLQCAPGLACVRGLCSGGELGDRCESAADCRTGLACGGDRKCGVPIVADAACDPLGLPCREGLACTSSAGASLCRAQARLGEACDGTVACYLGRCADGVCAPLSPDGGACESAADCLPLRACTEKVCGVRFACGL